MSDGDVPPILKERERLEDVVRVVLKGSREDADMSQEALARKLHLTRNQIANIEGGRSAVRMVDFVMIAKALHIGPERLLRRILQW